MLVIGTDARMIEALPAICMDILLFYSGSVAPTIFFIFVRNHWMSSWKLAYLALGFNVDMKGSLKLLFFSNQLVCVANGSSFDNLGSATTPTFQIDTTHLLKSLVWMFIEYLYTTGGATLH